MKRSEEEFWNSSMIKIFYLIDKHNEKLSNMSQEEEIMTTIDKIPGF